MTMAMTMSMNRNRLVPSFHPLQDKPILKYQNRQIVEK